MYANLMHNRRLSQYVQVKWAAFNLAVSIFILYTRLNSHHFLVILSLNVKNVLIASALSAFLFALLGLTGVLFDARL